MLRDRLLWLGSGLYALAFFALGSIRYDGHRSFVDSGIFSQTAASAFGCFCNTIEGSHWAFHFSPVLYAAGALVAVWHSPLALVALQALGGALTAAPIYGIVRRRADRRTARLAALVVLLYPPLAGVTFNDFHENGLASAAVAWMLWAFDGGLLGWTAVLAVVTLSIKEDQAIFLAVAGALGAWQYRGDPARARLAGGIGAAGILVAVLFFAAIAPHAHASAPWNPERFYAWTATDWRALFPVGVAARLGFLALALVPLLFLPVRVPEFAIAVLPLCEVLASRMSTTYTMGSHYAGAWIGYVLFAFALAVSRGFAKNPRRTRAVLVWCAALCALEFVVADPVHPAYFLHARAARDTALDTFLSRLPGRIEVATQEEAFTHLAMQDPHASLLPESGDTSLTACYLLTDSDFPQSPRLVESAPLVRTLTAQGRYRIALRAGAITLYKSRACP